MEASITLKKVGKKIDDKTIVAGLTFGIERGSLVAIIGANDTGKSTLLRLLSGTEKPDYGSIFIHGLDMQKRKRKTRRLVGFLPNETDLDPWLTIEKNIRFSALLYNVSNHDYRSRLQSFSKTLVPGNNAFPIHPVLNRSLTPREAARIQTFPDNLVLKGSSKDQCTQVGNAFPCLLAELLGETITTITPSGTITLSVINSVYTYG